MPDPATEKLVSIFHPRKQSWDDHFRWNGFRIVGRTSTGRATVSGLKMNRSLAQAIRAEEALRGRHPPPYIS